MAECYPLSTEVYPSKYDPTQENVTLVNWDGKPVQVGEVRNKNRWCSIKYWQENIPGFKELDEYLSKKKTFYIEKIIEMKQDQQNSGPNLRLFLPNTAAQTS